MISVNDQAAPRAGCQQSPRAFLTGKGRSRRDEEEEPELSLRSYSLGGFGQHGAENSRFKGPSALENKK